MDIIELSIEMAESKLDKIESGEEPKWSHLWRLLRGKMGYSDVEDVKKRKELDMHPSMNPNFASYKA